MSVYLLGGLSGAAFYVLAFNVFPVFESVNVACYWELRHRFLPFWWPSLITIPICEINLSFIGTFQLKYIALFYVLLSVIGISASNPGGNIAHLGGAFWGWFYIYQLGKGKDMVPVLLNFLIKLQMG